MSSTRDKSRDPPLSVRLSAEERAIVCERAEAAGLSINAFFRAAAMDATPSRKHRRVTVDQRAVAKLLGEIGRIGSNVNQLTRLAHMGAWPDAEMLSDAAADIQWMRRELMVAIGVTPEPPPGEQVR